MLDFGINRPRICVAIGLLATLAVAPGILRLHLRTDGHALVPESAPEVLLDDQIRQRFGLDDPLVILIRTKHPDGVFNQETLGLVVRLTDSLEHVEGVRAWTVFSLATEHNDRVWPGTLKFRRFLEPFPETDQERMRIRDDLRAIKLYTGTVISRDERATAVMVGVPPGALRTDFYGQVLELIDELGPVSDQLSVIGAPVAEALLGTHIMEDLGVPKAILGHATFSGDAESGGSDSSSFYALRVWIARHIGLLPIAIGIIAFTFLVSFRSVTAAALPMIEVLAALMFVFGVMGWTGVPVYLTIAVLPIILVVTGVTDEIHLFTRYRNLLTGQGAFCVSETGVTQLDHVAVVRASVRDIRPAIIKTSLTTAVGCLSFALSPLSAVRAFGIFTALGVLFCMVWSLTVIPASLVLIDPKRIASLRDGFSVPDASTRSSSFLSGLASLVIRLRWPVILIALSLVALGPYGVRRVLVQDSWIDGFAAESEFRRSTEFFNEQFLGTHLLHVVVQADLGNPLTGTIAAHLMRSQSITLPGALATPPAELVGKWLRVRRADAPAITNRSEGPVDAQEMRRRKIGVEWSAPIETATLTPQGIEVVCGKRHGSARAALRLYGSDSANFEIYSRPMMDAHVLQELNRFEAFLAAQTDDAVGGVIGPSAYIKTTNFMARARSEAERSIPDQADRIEWLWEQYQRIRGIERRREIVSDDYSTAIVTIFLNDANFIDTARLLDATRIYAREHLEPAGLSISFAGDVAVSQTLIEAIVTTQVRSLLGALIGIVLITSIMGRSILWGLLSALPCSLAVLTNFAFMGYVGMPLGVATSMFTGMTLGMGIDYAVHFIERYRHARAGGSEARDSIQNALTVTGPAILIDAVAVALGFGVLVFSQVPANARLGALVILSLVVCLVSSFLLLPAIIAVAARAGRAAPVSETMSPVAVGRATYSGDGSPVDEE